MGRRSKTEFRLSLDGDGRTYKRDIGKELNGKGGYKASRFWLGTDPKEAAIRSVRLEQVWDAVRARWERHHETPEPVWDAPTKAIGKAVARGEEVCRLPAELFDSEVRERAAAFPEGWGVPLTEEYLVANRQLCLASLQKDIPAIRLALEGQEDDPDGPALLQQRADSYAREAARLADQAARVRQLGNPEAPAAAAGAAAQRLHAAIDAFAAHVRATKVEEGKPTQHAGRVCGQLKTIKEHQPDMPLADFGLEVIDGLIAHWRGLPQVKVARTGRTQRCSSETAKNHIKRVREFVRWLHKAKDWAWRKPEDYEVLPARVADDYDRDDETLNSEQVKTYSIDELAKLWEYGSPLERLYMVLALNCGFGAAEVATLKVKQVHLDINHPFYKFDGSFIGRKRKKTRVYSEWLLWPVTAAALRWYQSVRPPSASKGLILSKQGRPLAEPTKGGNRNQAIPNAWGRVTARIRKDVAGFRHLSFNKLRKTASNAIRDLGGGEIAGVFGGRGKPVKSDDQSERYANRPFPAVFAAIRTWGDQLAAVFGTVSEPFPPGAGKSNPSTSLGKIKEVHRLRAEGVTMKEIAARTGVAYGTVRFHLGKAKRKAGDQAGG